MARKPVTPAPQLVELLFPIAGLDLSGEYGRQRPRTAPVGVNVRSFDTLAGSARGGSRAGLARHIDETVAGVHEIQHMNIVVSTSGEALGWAGMPVDFNLFGFDFGPALSFGPGGTPGGGGYYPSASFQKNRVWTLALTSTGTSWPANGNTVPITATLTEIAGGAPVAGKTIKLRTYPAGEVGHNVTGLTNGAGEVVFDVSDTQVEHVKYAAAETSSGVGSNQVLDFTWFQDISPAAARIEFTAYAPRLRTILKPEAGLIEFMAYAPTVGSPPATAYMFTTAGSTGVSTSGTVTCAGQTVVMALNDNFSGLVRSTADITVDDISPGAGSWILGDISYASVVPAYVQVFTAALATGNVDVGATGDIPSGIFVTGDVSITRLHRYGRSKASEIRYLGGSWVAATLTFTTAGEDPIADGIAVGEWAAVGTSTVNALMIQVLSRTTTTVTFDMSTIGGAPNDVVPGDTGSIAVSFGFWRAIFADGDIILSDSFFTASSDPFMDSFPYTI